MRQKAKLVLLILGIFMSGEIFAQTISINAGLNFSKFHFSEDEDISSSLKFKTGFNAGLTAEFPVLNIFSIKTGFLVSPRGYKCEDIEGFGNITNKYVTKINIYYLDVPLLSQINVKYGDIKYLFAFGPYLGIGLFGYDKEVTTLHDEEPEISIYDIELGSDVDRLDFGLCFKVGVEIKSFQICLNHGLGLSNILPSDEYSDKIMHRVWGLSVGYRFLTATPKRDLKNVHRIKTQ